ncbi:MFS transporter [Nonomuraea rhodomycinica]|uniref:MFS transporter n=1 Tax=Nonomuraea rhodomycinica TaxID=1712872 RepID=A0A7Y6IK23_9ACTN|nr:MFS transporter [Nonomuraea rhodomycinica]NUW39568.1 MFS transporter [Nonomuraea rhodomycinica]
MPSPVARRPGWTLAMAATAGYLLVLDLTGVNVALPAMRDDLGAGLGEVQWAVDAYALTLAVLLLTAGALADRWGRRRLFLAGLGVFTAGSLACALAPGALALDLFRAAQGCGAAILFGTASPLLAAAYPPGRRRDHALGMFAAASGAAIATGPLLGGALTEVFGWRAIFFLNVPVGVLALVIAPRVLAESRDARPRPLDPVATACLTAGLGGVMWALIEGPRIGWTAPGTITCVAVATAATAVLALRRVADPMIDLSLLRDRLYAANTAAALAFHAAGAGALAYFSLYVQGPMGARPAQAGLWFLTFSVPALAAPVLLGRIMHRLPSALLVAAGPALAAVSSLLLAATYELHSWPAMVPGFVVGGTSIGIGNLVTGRTALASAPAGRAGVAAGIANTAKQVGVAAGVAVLGVPYQLDGLGAMLLTAAAIGGLGAIPALRLMVSRTRRQGTLPPPPAASDGSPASQAPPDHRPL